MPIRKKGNIDIRTSAKGAQATQTGYTFYSYDKNAAALYFQFRGQDGQPTDLGKATIHLVMILNDDGGKEFIPKSDEIEVISAIRGTAKYVLPEMLLSYEGKVTGYVYMDFDDGSQSDDGQFTFRIKQSMITHVLPEAGDKYVQDFEDVKERVEQAGDSATKDIEKAKDSAESQIGEYVGEVESAKDNAVEDIDKALLVDEAKNYTDDKVEEFNETITTQLAHKDVYTPKANISEKAIYNKLGTVFVVTQKANGNGYLRFRLQENQYTTTESVGSPAELLRATGIDNVFDCFLIKNQDNANSGTEWINGNISYLQPDGGAKDIPTRQLSSKTQNAWIEYQLDVPVGVNAVEFLIYGTGGSSTDVDISVDGEIKLSGQNFSRSTNEWFRVAVPVIPGQRTIRLTNNTYSYLTTAGVLVTLKDYKKGFNFDTIVTFHQGDNKYVSADGAMEYALFDADTNQWCGSYHGGETRNRLLFLLDGEPIALKEGEMRVGNIFEIEQDTNISGKINSYTRQRFESNGSIEHETIFDGNINLTKLYTNMSTTSDQFDDILYPIRHTLVDEGNKYLPSGINYVVQRNSSTNQKAITVLNNNMFPKNKKPKPFIKKSIGAYNKVYNVNIDSNEPVNFKGGNFRTVHIFE